MAVKERPIRSRRPPLDAAGLEQIALNYLGRYATTRAKLAAYLLRKLADRGWSEPGDPPAEAVLARLARLGYVDDRPFPPAPAAALSRRGHGEPRTGHAPRPAGARPEDAPGWQEEAGAGLTAALRLAEGGGIGPFAAEEPDRAGREKAMGILLRAGHPPALARRVASCRPGEFPDANRG